MDLWKEAYPRLTATGPGAFGRATSRAEAHALRLALHYALLDRSTQIKTGHLRAGLAVWEYAERSAAYIFGDTTGDRDADKILEALRAAPEGMTRHEIRRELFGDHKPAETIASALATLLRLGLVRQELVETGGRPAERWFAVSGALPCVESVKSVGSPPDTDPLLCVKSVESVNLPPDTDPYHASHAPRTTENAAPAPDTDSFHAFHAAPAPEPDSWSEEGARTA
jgi:hypothetical protein